MKYLALSRSKRDKASLLVRGPLRNPGFHQGACPFGRRARSRFRPLATRLFSTRCVVSEVRAVSPAKKHETLLVSMRYILVALLQRSTPYRFPLCVAEAARIFTPWSSASSPGAIPTAWPYPCFFSHLAIAGGANRGMSSGSASRESNER